MAAPTKPHTPPDSQPLGCDQRSRPGSHPPAQESVDLRLAQLAHPITQAATQPPTQGASNCDWCEWPTPHPTHPPTPPASQPPTHPGCVELHQPQLLRLHHEVVEVVVSQRHNVGARVEAAVPAAAAAAAARTLASAAAAAATTGAAAAAGLLPNALER